MTTSIKKLTETEEQLHKAFMQWVGIHPLLKHLVTTFIHVPNEGKRTVQFGKKLKTLGMRKGVSDIFIAYPSRAYHGAWIELKTPKGKLSDAQRQFLDDMNQNGYFATAAFGFDEAKEAVEYYFELRD